eukprot:1470745-Rhodomonas_salina.2
MAKQHAEQLCALHARLSPCLTLSDSGSNLNSEQGDPSAQHDSLHQLALHVAEQQCQGMAQRRHDLDHGRTTILRLPEVSEPASDVLDPDAEAERSEEEEGRLQREGEALRLPRETWTQSERVLRVDSSESVLEISTPQINCNALARGELEPAVELGPVVQAQGAGVRVGEAGVKMLCRVLLQVRGAAKAGRRWRRAEEDARAAGGGALQEESEARVMACKKGDGDNEEVGEIIIEMVGGRDAGRAAERLG